ncbi:HEAT repeat domain-containing protein [Methanoculleus sp. 10]|uniref:HEAT repeat domain-containing protein n=1 Tax=Methanoculleus sp. 10 TaxID=430615 RepID=UPI0025F594EC|nr:HEAT repeat domain-containing protein [Methanoculleus sp. 10]
MTHAMLPETGDEHPHEHDLQPLLSRLFDPDKVVRAQAVQGLAAIGRPAVPACIALLQDADWRVRYRAAEALGLIGDGEAYTPSLPHSATEKTMSATWRRRGSGCSATPGGCTPGAMQRDENEFVRRSAARSLGMIGGAEAIGLLRAALGDEATEGVRAAILAALRDAGVEGA